MLSTSSEQGGRSSQPGRQSEKHCQWRPKPQNGRINATYAARARDLVLVGLAVALLLITNGEYNRCVLEGRVVGGFRDEWNLIASWSIQTIWNGITLNRNQEERRLLLMTIIQVF